MDWTGILAALGIVDESAVTSDDNRVVETAADNGWSWAYSGLGDIGETPWGSGPQGQVNVQRLQEALQDTLGVQVDRWVWWVVAGGVLAVAVLVTGAVAWWYLPGGGAAAFGASAALALPW